MTGKLTVDAASGHVTGPASITYNEPFPCVNGSWGSGAIQGVVMHTMVGNLPGTITVFNEPAFQASAHFGIDQQGNIHQFGPIGKGWIAWAEEAGNAAWYSIEHADDGDPANPLTGAQITASAQLLEVLSRFAGFPLQVTDSTTGTGYGTHVMGGAAWGGHTCPGPGPRAGQRAQIVALAQAIRSGTIAPSVREWTTAGMSSLASLASQQHTDPATILHLTAAAGAFPADVAALVNGVFGGTVSPSEPMPAGLKLWLPGSLWPPPRSR
jgi:hypothetical protein